MLMVGKLMRNEELLDRALMGGNTVDYVETTLQQQSMRLVDGC